MTDDEITYMKNVADGNWCFITRSLRGAIASALVRITCLKSSETHLTKVNNQINIELAKVKAKQTNQSEFYAIKVEEAEKLKAQLKERTKKLNAQAENEKAILRLENENAQLESNIDDLRKKLQQKILCVQNLDSKLDRIKEVLET